MSVPRPVSYAQRSLTGPHQLSLVPRSMDRFMTHHSERLIPTTERYRVPRGIRRSARARVLWGSAR